MATKKKTAARDANLPLLAVACICEKVLTEDSVNSLIRIVDTVFLPDDFPLVVKKDNEGIELPMSVVLMFRAGSARGDFTCDVTLSEPDGEHIEIAKISMHMDKDKAVDNTGVSFNLPVRIRWKGFGLYWFIPKMSGKVLTRIPLKVAPVETKHTYPGSSKAK